MSKRKYTLSLPTDLYNEVKDQADKHEISVTEVVRQCLKFGLVGMRVSEDPNLDLYIRERTTTTNENGQSVQRYKESLVQFIW